MNVRNLIGQPKSPGLKAREQQLADVRKDAAPAQEAGEVMRGSIGSVDARRRLEVAKRALKRQQQYAAGQYPSGR